MASRSCLLAVLVALSLGMSTDAQEAATLAGCGRYMRSPWNPLSKCSFHKLMPDDLAWPGARETACL